MWAAGCPVESMLDKHGQTDEKEPLSAGYPPQSLVPAMQAQCEFQLHSHCLSQDPPCTTLDSFPVRDRATTQRSLNSVTVLTHPRVTRTNNIRSLSPVHSGRIPSGSGSWETQLHSVRRRHQRSFIIHSFNNCLLRVYSTQLLH